MMEAEQITEQFNRSLNINDADREEKYKRFRQQGKEAAQQGDLELSLHFFRQAFDLRPSDKMQSRIQRVEEAIKEMDMSEETDEFVDVLGSGLMMYKVLYDQLYEHQKEGVAFLYSLHRDGRGGGILADDMGLGKTVQVLSFLSAMYDAELTSRTLLIMPTTLIKNWLREFKRWTPGLRVKEFHGTSKSERSRNLERIQRGSGAIITTYQMLINNWQQLASFGGQEFTWDYVILDEAHKIKSSSTKTAKSVRAVPARHRLLLTGTPVQNNLQEMWALFDFACQGALLGSAKTFKAEYENPITRAREKDATPGEKALGLKISQNLFELIRPYFLRRTKTEVQDRKRIAHRAKEEDQEQEVQDQQSSRVSEIPSLMRKTDLIVWTYLSDIQEDIYRQFISLDHIKELLTTTRSPLADLTVLKKLCDHPRLLSARAVTQLGLGVWPADFHEDDCQSAPGSSIVDVTDETLISESGKLRFLLSLMESLRDEGKRTLIFSQSRKMLDIIERVLTNRKFRLLRVDGTITQLAERERRIALFQTDARYSVFLLTTQVGGVGLTLTAANRVVIFDPSWNPATDAQAIDRAYRIGQTNDVIVYRLITCGSVEEKIYRRQVFKDSLIRQTMGDKKNPSRYFSKQELKELFTLEDMSSSSTQLQLQLLHSSACRSDPELQRHISSLKSMNVFGVSRHDLLFSNEEDEDTLQDEEQHYIDQRVQKAQDLVQAESQLHSLMMDNVNQNTEPAWLRLSRQRGPDQHAAMDDVKTTPPCHNLCPPAVVDLTQSGSDELEMSMHGGMEVKDEHVIDLSTQVTDDSYVGRVFKSINDEESLIMEEKANHTHSHSNQTLHISPFKPSDSSVVLLGIASNIPKALSEPDASKPLLGVGSDSSMAPMAKSDLSKSMVGVVSDSEELMGSESFQGNFNLQLEDSAELLSEDKQEDVNQEEVELSTGGEDFQLQMEETGERLNESNNDGGRQKSVYFTPADESLLCPTKKKKRQVIYESEEEGHEEEEVEKPLLASSPLARSFMGLGTSTPKSMLNNGTNRRCSMNTSVASRRSLVESLLQDMEEELEEGEEPEDEPEEEGSSEGVVRIQETEADGTYASYAYESVVEEAEPCRETLNSEHTSEWEEPEEEDSAEGVVLSQASKTSDDESVLEEAKPSEHMLECEEEEECEEDEEGDGIKSFTDESTDVELASSEFVHQCASAEVQSPNDVKHPEESFDSLVHSGKQCLAEGRKQEALDFFLKAIDINTGDSEIQLLIIQLYRNLSH
uniref:DNA excision repair protein ERCC-6-like n=1 Tax=Ictalurus punctatus TaxID=7998 RepID=W5UDP1_ICTPU